MEAAPPPMEDVPRSSVDSSSSSLPEFEFWVVGNHPSSPDPNILTADELFVDGVLRPLHLLSLSPSDQESGHNKEPEPEPAPQAAPVDPSASICSPATVAATSPSASKRWKDIFKVGEKKSERKKDRCKGSAGGSAELNISSIWPFSRSRSAGNAARTRPAASAMAGRKASSAPCSRSNSRGESSKPLPSAASGSARRWAASPGRPGLSGGVHLGRSSPVWQPRRTAMVGENPAAKEKAAVAGTRRGGGPRVLSLNVNTCIGYGNPMTCRDGGGAAAAATSGNGSLFNLRTIFSKKIY